MSIPSSKYNTVVFDVDSTLVKIEGLDFLAQIKRKSRVLKKLTSSAMNGNISMREAMEKKMSAIAPNYQDLVKMGKAYIKNITPGAKKTISALKKAGISVWICTGNFQPAVGMLAKELGIKKANVIANTIFLDKKKNYLGFDVDNPLSNNGGKAKVMKKYKNKMKKTVFVGDGNTDLDTQSVVDLFIGFGGVVEHPHVAKLSKLYVNDKNLTAILPFILCVDNQS